ncbi:MAG: hypothetical protein COY66_01270 [Candidatus Kerfeldbacteria bacterium CG_4_10_14_0_8_um_filter_42_10]|uniref:HAD family hydrolase n=1 Tax=Candidatus Kerfeldbacteria bacterium CG_4_10_14_0_8_um_filter_42_10 TaxID=2014248 RepID=A0A2M7RK22_9BACT|nr:MAG: hypothetical protein COY66_01270 [Candidatus Kerfeldbacteria bacterium CG_4_10_14_0_8_um_filter_42_10]
MAKKPIFLFDFDGVIADTLNEVCQTFDIFFKRLGLIQPNREEVRLMYKRNIHDSLKERGVTEDNFKDLWALIRSREKEVEKRIRMYPHMAELLKKLSKYNIYIVSSSSTKAIESYANRMGFGQYLKAILGAEAEVFKVKKINRILNDEGVNPKEAYFVTDTVGDVIEGKKTGVNTIAVAWGYHKKEELEKTSPDYLFNAPEELIKTITDLCKISE